jgi:hypothetical protein
MAFRDNMKIRAADERLLGRHRVHRPCGDEIEARVSVDRCSVTGLRLEIWIDRQCACVVRPHERDADTVTIQMGGGESPPLKVSVPQQLTGGQSVSPMAAHGHAEMSRYVSDSSVENHDQLTASAAIGPDVASPGSLLLRLGLPYGHCFIVRSDAWVGTVAVCPVGTGLHGLIEVLVPPAVLSTSR